MEGVRILEVAAVRLRSGGGASSPTGVPTSSRSSTRAWRHAARLHQHRWLRAGPGAASADRASQSREAQRRHRRVHPGRAGGPLRDGQDLRRVPHQLHARSSARRTSSTSNTSARSTRTSSMPAAAPTATRDASATAAASTAPLLDAQRHWPRLTPRSWAALSSQGIPAFGDSIGGMNIAGGISAALFHRGAPGEAIGTRRLVAEHGVVGGRASVTQVMETG